MCFNGTDWQTEQALKEKKLICKWATSELYPLIETTYQEIKNVTDLNLLENKFRQEFTKIVSNEKSKYYKTDYFYWFFNEADKEPSKRISIARGNIFRFLLIKAGDLLYIKTSDKDIIRIAYIKNNSNISFGKTYYDRTNEGYEYNAFFLDDVEFSEPIKKNVLFEKCYTLLNEKYPNEKDVLLDSIKANINYLNGTCLYALEKEDDFKLKEVFYEALNFYTNQDMEYKTDLRCDGIMDILIDWIEERKNTTKENITYGELCSIYNSKYQDDKISPNRFESGVDNVRDTLYKIHYKCENLNIPHLNYLVVHKTDGKCGDGANFGLDEENERKSIWQYDWKSYKYIENEIKSVDDDKNNTDVFQNISETRVESRVPFPSMFVEMVLNKYPNLKDKCQSCEEFFFEKEGGGFYFEIHHIKHYSKCRKEGINPHTIENCTALCPNCHKNEHFGKKNNRKF